MSAERHPGQAARGRRDRGQDTANATESAGIVRYRAHRRSGQLLRVLQVAVPAGAWARVRDAGSRLELVGMAALLADAEESGDRATIRALELQVRAWAARSRAA